MNLTNTEVKNPPSPLLDEMRKARETSNVAFITFTDNHDKFLSHIFCFYEGEDGKYYNQRIKSILGDRIIPIKSGNKRNTLKIWRKLKEDDNYNTARKMFFVDKDMDDIPADINEDLYVTPCYSIENLYVNLQTFRSILESEFSLNEIDNDFLKCTEIFTRLFEQFCNEMIEFNSLVLLRKQKNLCNGRVDLGDIKTNQMISININKVTKGIKYNEIISNLKDKLNVKDIELQNAINEIKLHSNFSDFFRGKNQLDFMVILIRILKHLSSEGKLFEKKRTNVTIDLTNNRLSELSQYALFPPCLREFITKHKIEMSH